MRSANGSDFHVDVEGVGRFQFGRRTMRDVFLIRSEYNRLSNGNYSAEGVPVDMGAWAVATINVLLVASPPEFDLTTVDPLMDETWEDKTAKVFTSLRDMELSFRKKRPPPGQSPSP
jgi:hypothetical protein